MFESRYRIQTDTGLSPEYSLDDLRKVAKGGSLSSAAQCTTDDGATWTSVDSVIRSAGPANVAVQASESSLHSESSPSDSTTTNVDSASTVDGIPATRKLKRINKTDGESRYAKKRADREQRKKSAVITKPEELIGAELGGGRYLVKSMLGKGSMAYVFLVSDKRLETDAVVKVPKPEKFTTADFRVRFKRECQLLVRFSHPHVVKVLDVGDHGALPYVVMQLLSGGSLTDRMAREADGQGRMSPESLKSWVRETGRALDFCFRKGMVHRDVKPANILFDEDNNPYVADFGLSKVMYGEHEDLNSSETAAGIVLGTPNYISPEVVLGQPYDGRADQYSLGITIYHALAGKPPMQGNSATATMVNQTQLVLDLLSDVRPDAVSRPLANAIRRGIEKDPKKRFDSCEQFADAILEGLRAPVGSHPVAHEKPSRPASAAAQQAGSSESGSKRSKASSGNSAAQSRKSAASSASRRTPKKAAPVTTDMEWFDLSEDEEMPAEPRPASRSVPSRPKRRSPSSAALPPRKSDAKKKGKAKKSAKPATVGLFGMDVHPALAVGLTAGLMMILLVVVVRRFFFGEDVVEPAIASASVEVAVSPGQSADGGGHDAENRSRPKRKTAQKSQKQASSSQATGSESPALPSPENSVQVALAEPRLLANSDRQKSDIAVAPEKSTSEPTSLDDMARAPAESARANSLFDSIPFSASEGFTIGVANCPVMLSGNRVWDKSTRSVRHQLQGVFDGRAQTALSPDGRLFAATSKPPDQQNTAVTVWDTQTGKQLFTAAGESKRFADVVLLSATSLYIGDRWSEELLVWDCESGSKGKSIKLNAAKFKRGNAAISKDGQYIAAMAQGRMVILNTADGNIGGLMQNPGKSVRMKPGSLKSTRSRSKNRTQNIVDEAEPVFAAMQSLSFSVDNQELAGFSTFPRSRFMAWNSMGELTVDRAAASVTSGIPGGAFQWFDDREAWLVSGSILDRNTGRVVLTTLSDASKHTSVSVYDDDHLVSVLRNSPNELSIIPIPWDTIEDSLQRITHSDEALLAVGSTVSLQVQLATLFGKNSQEFNDVRKAMRDTLTREGLKVDTGSGMLFRINIADDPEEKTSILNRLIPAEMRRETPNVETQPDGDCVVLELLPTASSTEPIWRVNLGSLADLGLANTPKRVAADKLMSLIDEMNFPYYLPSDDKAVGLPIVID